MGLSPPHAPVGAGTWTMHSDWQDNIKTIRVLPTMTIYLKVQLQPKNRLLTTVRSRIEFK